MGGKAREEGKFLFASKKNIGLCSYKEKKKRERNKREGAGGNLRGFKICLMEKNKCCVDRG